MVCIKDPLVQKIYQLYEKISNLDDLSPSDEVNTLLTELVVTCIPPHPIDVSTLCSQLQDMRAHLISLSGHAEGLLEKHYSSILGSLDRPLDCLHLFPYYSNYLHLARLEFDLLRQHGEPPRRVAFIGSGPLPLSSIVLATHHLGSSAFDNFDVDASANALASKLVAPHPDVSARMRFTTTDIMDVTGEVLRSYDAVFLAALVGMEMEEKVAVIEHLARNMAAGATLMVRSAHGARAFLYPVVEARHLRGFEVLSVYHPTDEVINSIIIARRRPEVAQPNPGEVVGHKTIARCNCGGMQSFKPQLGMEEHLCS